MNNEERVEPLAVLDPGRGNPGYWNRFHAAVIERAVYELARRRELARQSVAAVLSGWSRSLIPVALAAAAIAAVVIGSESRVPSDVAPLALEDVLNDDVGDGSFAAVLSGSDAPSGVAFMALVEEGGN